MTFREPVKFRLFYWECEEEGSGYYSRNLVGVLRPVLDPVKYVLAPAIDDIPFNAVADGPFMIADYGCRDGGISVPLIKHLIDCVRQKHEPIPDVHIMYEDQPYCDFKSLFLMANGLTGAEYDSAWSNQDGVFFSVVGRSFFEQCLPRNSVHVGFSSHAVVYLSRRPCLLPDVIMYPLSTDEHKKALLAEQGASDWETFLLNRCRELVHGGILFVVALYMTEDGQYEGATKGTRNLFQTMHTIWKQLYQEGKITEKELEEPTFNWYIRTVEEFKAPFLNKNSAVYIEGLRLVSLETQLMHCPTQAKLQERGVNDPENVAECAHELVMSIRPWTSGDFLAALSSRPEAERRGIVDDLFQRMEARFQAEPTLHKEDCPTIYIMMRKILD